MTSSNSFSDYYTPASLRERLEVKIRLLQDLADGLAGIPFHWNRHDSTRNLRMAAALGCSLLTNAAIERLGFRLKRQAQAVGYAHFDGLPGCWAVYMLEVHAAPLKTALRRKMRDGSDLSAVINQSKR